MTELLATPSPATRARNTASAPGDSFFVQPIDIRSTMPGCHMWLGTNGTTACTKSVFHNTSVAKRTTTGSLGEMT